MRARALYRIGSGIRHDIVAVPYPLKRIFAGHKSIKCRQPDIQNHKWSPGALAILMAL